MKKCKVLTTFRRILKSTFLSVLGLLAASWTHASAEKWRPEWTSQALGEWGPNSSVLNGHVNMRNSTILDDVIDNDKALILRQRYDILSQDYEFRQRYHVPGIDPDDYYRSRMDELGNDALHEAQMKKERQSLARATEIVGDYRKGPKSLTVLAAAAYVGSGRPVDLPLGAASRVHMAAHIPYNVAYVQIFSPWINTKISVAGESTENAMLKRLFQRPPDEILRNERVYLGVNRDLPFWELNSGMGYGLTSNSVSASLSKALFPGLRGTVESAFPLDAAYGSIRMAQATARLNYEIHF